MSSGSEFVGDTDADIVRRQFDRILVERSPVEDSVTHRGVAAEIGKAIFAANQPIVGNGVFDASAQRIALDRILDVGVGDAAGKKHRGVPIRSHCQAAGDKG